jgi:hypothetical protein
MISVCPDQRLAADLHLLLAEACDLCRRANDIPLTQAEVIALHRLYGEMTLHTKIAFAFRGIYAARIRKWIRHANMASRSLKLPVGNTTSKGTRDLIGRLQQLIDIGRAASLRRRKSPSMWASFYAAATHRDVL